MQTIIDLNRLIDIDEQLRAQRAAREAGTIAAHELLEGPQPAL